MTPIPAATLLLLRDGSRGLEVLMGRRRDSATFGGFWAFPGGVLEDVDYDSNLTGLTSTDAPWRSAALRETAEEVGVFVTDPELADPPVGLKGGELLRAVAGAGSRFAGERLVYMANWITPVQAPRRFDTRFFAAAIDGGHVDPVAELAEVAWIEPAEALAKKESSMPLMLPTIAQLRLLEPYSDTDGFLRSIDQALPVSPIEPRVIATEEGFSFLLPGDEGYDSA